MRDQINRNNVIAEENVNLTGHPAKEKFGRWETNITDNDDTFDQRNQRDTPCEREKKIEQMDEIIEEGIDRLKG